MKKLLLPVAVLIALWSCSHKTAPVKTDTSTTTSTTTTPIVTTSGDAVAGKSTYVANCGRCHGLKDPGEFTAAQWVPIVNSMAPKARLTDTEKGNVLAYVQANAKQ